MLSLGWLDQTISMGSELEWLLVAFAIFAAGVALRLVVHGRRARRSRDEPSGPPHPPAKPLAPARR